MGLDMLSHVYYLARTFAYYMHRAKMISLGRWPGDPGRKPKSLTKNNEYLNDKNNNSFIAGPADDAVPVSTHALVQYGQHMDITATAWNLVPPNPV